MHVAVGEDVIRALRLGEHDIDNARAHKHGASHKLAVDFLGLAHRVAGVVGDGQVRHGVKTVGAHLEHEGIHAGVGSLGGVHVAVEGAEVLAVGKVGELFRKIRGCLGQGVGEGAVGLGKGIGYVHVEVFAQGDDAVDVQGRGGEIQRFAERFVVDLEVA